MLKILHSSWPLFFGLLLIMIGNGLQGTLLGVRASIEGFDTATIGFIMSLYYLGFLGGSYYVPRLISSVGHIRVFTALASLASATVLLHGLFPDPILWAGIRIFTGFAYAGLYIVVESWLNDASTNKTRGKLFAIYQVIGFGGMVIGQFGLNIADPETIQLFAMTSILVSLALMPISLSSRPAPDFTEPDHLSLKRLYVISPLGLAGCFAVGVGTGALFGIGAVYAKEIGMTLPQISTFMALYIFGGVASQIPIGWLSDNYDRRLVLIGTALLSGVISIACLVMSGSPYALNALIFCLGAISLPIYGLSMSHINDHLTPRQYVAAGASAILINGVGAALGPFGISIIMSIFGTVFFFPLIAVVFFWLFGYALYRTTKRDAIPLDEQGDHMQVPIRATPLTMTITEEGHAVMKEMQEDEND
jgi:MFS family permease